MSHETVSKSHERRWSEKEREQRDEIKVIRSRETDKECVACFIVNISHHLKNNEEYKITS